MLEGLEMGEEAASEAALAVVVERGSRWRPPRLLDFTHAKQIC